jgi:Transglycosylase SLT domain
MLSSYPPTTRLVLHRKPTTSHCCSFALIALLTLFVSLPSYGLDATLISDENASKASSVREPATANISQKKIKTELEAMQHLKAVLSTNNVKKEAVVEEEKNPYEQLVKLAFRGKGTNGVNSYKDASVLYCKNARDNNDANAQFALGWMYANGRGFTIDKNIAALFFSKAAEQGHSTAKKWLADIDGNASQAVIPQCMLPDHPKQITTTIELAAPDSNRETFYDKGPIYEIVNRLAPKYGIETDLVMAFIKVESNFNPKATSPKNAQGLMQLIPETSARFNVRNPYKPEDNIKGGLAYLQWLLAYFEGDVRLVAAAYNAGENAVDRHKGVPPYPETRKYVKKIYKLYRKSFHPFRQDLLIGEKSKIIRVSSNP